MPTPEEFPDVHDDAFFDQEDVQEDLHDEVGESPLDPGSGRRPSRKGIFLMLGAIVLLAGSLGLGLRLMRGGSGEVATETRVQETGIELAEVEQASAAGSTGLTGVTPQEERFAPRGGRSGQNDPVSLTGTESPASDASLDDPWADLEAEVASLTDTVEPELEFTTPDQQQEVREAADANETPSESFDYAALFRVEQEELRRREAEIRLAEAKQAEIQSFRERLAESAGTMVIRNERNLSESTGPRNPAVAEARAMLDGLGDDVRRELGEEAYQELQQAIADAEALDESMRGSGNAFAGPELTTARRLNVVPGTRIPAVTESEFRSGEAGSGTVQVVLQAPARAGGRVVLPAGTRGFGEARASGGAPGREARVQIEFHTFITPDERVFRNAVHAVAADPVTLASSVAGHVDRQMGSRVVRGAAATAFDLWVTRGSRALGYGQEPSQRDLATQQARTRANNILAPDIGNERSDAPLVYLPAGTEIYVLFGTNSRGR